MLTANEDKGCYATAAQRGILLDLLHHGIVTDHFFLTGGTALSVFYLHHRQSNDLDLFTRQPTDFGEMDFALKTTWQGRYVKIKSSPNFLSVLINDVKVDFVIDLLSLDEEREAYSIEPHHRIHIDTIRNIVSNKLCAIVSRTEPKDYFDFYALFKAIEGLSFNNVLVDARTKDAVFDDPPTAAYQIEQSVEFLRRNEQTFPRLLNPIKHEELFQFYDETVRRLYDLAIR